MSHAVITGASAGIGRVTARAFAERGYDVSLIARGSEGLDVAAKEVEQAGGRGAAIPVDVADADASSMPRPGHGLELGRSDAEFLRPRALREADGDDQAGDRPGGEAPGHDQGDPGAVDPDDVRREG